MDKEGASKQRQEQPDRLGVMTLTPGPNNVLCQVKG